jgi:tRNA(fMet)-specific endonuclease VapC
VGSGAARAAGLARRRGSQLERLILDTSILVAVERSGATLDAVIDDDDDVAIAAVTAAELLVGVQLADAKRRAQRRAFVDKVLAAVATEAYDLAVARFHADLLAHVRRSGRPRGAHDLQIAATALAHKRTVVSADATGFADLPGVALRVGTP